MALSRIQHKAEYAHWIGQGCNDQAVARQFDCHRDTVRFWRGAENWDAHAKADNAKLAKAILELRESRIVKYCDDTWDRLEQLQTILAHRYTEMQVRAVQGASIDSGEVKDLTVAEMNFQKAARTFLGLDNVKIGIEQTVTLTSADADALRNKLRGRAMEILALPTGTDA